MAASPVPQATKGDMAIAAELINNRINSLKKALNEKEQLKLQDLRRTVETEMGIDGLKKELADIQEANAEKVSAVATEHRLEIENIRNKRANENAAITEKRRLEDAELTEKRRVEDNKLAEEHKKKTDKLTAEAVKKNAQINEVSTRIERKISEESAKIKEMASKVRMNLDQEHARLNDEIYCSVLPASLKGVVDNAPKAISTDAQLQKLGLTV